MRRLPAGPGAVLVEVASTSEALRLYAAARAARLAVLDLVPAARTVLFDGVADPVGLDRFLDGVDLGGPADSWPASERVVEVPTTYDGADLGAVAQLWGMTEAEVVATHTQTDFVVAFCGFVPGFAYCTGLPAALAVPRLERPRPQVPAGSVGLAGEFTGVYPVASPGGWRLLGTTELPLWVTDADPPATLSPGTGVRFQAVEP